MFARLFRDHPREVGETYWEHFFAASAYGVRLLGAAGCAFIHAMIPGLCKTAASDCVCEMADELGGRAREARECRMRDAGVWDVGL